MSNRRCKDDKEQRCKRKPILLLLALLLLALAVAGALTWYYLSEILRGTIVVKEQPYQLLNIYADFPSEVIVGQEFTVYFSVENPNPETIRGVIILVISKPGIHPDHIRISTGAWYGDSPVVVETHWNPSLYPDKVIYVIRPSWNIRYFYFTPGYNSDVAWVKIYFNHPGDYDYEVGVAWLE